ncbi:unnamed protein product, partial [marine sediment metagenome]
RELPAVCRGHGFHLLDSGPVLVGEVALVGSVGWYDYTFKDQTLNIPLRFYEAKLAPGAAARRETYTHLVDGHGDLTPEMLEISTYWMDGVRVRLPVSDIEFTERLVARLRTHLEEVKDSARTIVAVLHHLPFAELVKRNLGVGNWQFANAFMGSERFGELLLESPKVRHAFCGHSHSPSRVTHGALTCTNIGCTYVHKRFEEWQV